MDELVARGFAVGHNLERPVPRWAREADRVANRAVTQAGGYGGDFAGVLGSLGRANKTDVILSTVDTVGLPLVLLGRAGLARRPVVYTSIGLPERLERLRGERATRIYRDALRRTKAAVAFSEFEAETLRKSLGAGTPPVEFVPFGVDGEWFRPEPGREPDVDVVSIGADPHRDFALLVSVAERRPDLRFRIVTTADQATALGLVPANVELECDLPFREIRDRLLSGRAVALPVHENSYSGATTVLLQALACGKPVVVSRTKAITTGYGLEDGVNCRLVPPGDTDAFEVALAEVLAGDAELGARARETAEALSWERYAGALEKILRRAGAQARGVS
jgi:glycosyltransferase involved in cell wall biosynthesis